MAYYPVNLDVTDRACLVIGGGQVGARKVAGLLACGARVTVVGLAATPPIREWARKGIIAYHERAYRSDDLDGVFLVIGATNDNVLNQHIHAAARERQVLCNIADQPALCNFILPAVVRRGDLVIAASTSGQSPALAKKLRQELEVAYGEEYAQGLQWLGAIRKKLLATDHAPEAHKALFNKLIDAGLIEMIRDARYEELDTLLVKTLGREYNLKTLAVDIGPPKRS